MTCSAVRVAPLVLLLLLLAPLTSTAQISLVSTGSVWRYLDTGEDPGPTWRSLGFVDTAWSSGVAQLGFGDGDEATRISQTNALGEANITYYFRHTFDAGTIASLTNLLLRLRRDDGAVVYLNGVEIFRSNLPLGEVLPSTLAASASDDGETWFDISLNPQLLANGPNILAVEMHQASATSSDLSFDLELRGNVPFAALPLVYRGAVWKYLDDGSDPGVTWATVEFNDSGWSNGLAQLGFGDGDESTRVRQSSAISGTNAISYYFRHAFSLSNPAQVTSLVARTLRDDGAVLYLNGTEVARLNMPTGSVDSTTFAATVVGNDNLYHSRRIDPSLLRSGVNIVAVEVHQFNLTSSDISFDLELRANVPPTPPVVSIVSPTNTASVFGPTNLQVDALAIDYDTAVSSVGFYVSGDLRGTDSTDAYDADGRNFSQVISNLASGNYTLTAVATDSTGLTSTSAPVNISVIAMPYVLRLISSNSVWKYLDTGTNQGTAWQSSDFNDAAWPSGAAKLGTNDLGTNTVIKIRTAAGLIIPTSYFRHSFVVTNTSAFTNLAFRVVRDDGCIAYLNGFEIFRMNMQTGAVTFNTYVPTIDAVGGSSEFTFFPTNISSSFLVEGTNVLAVELHQTSNTTDAGFDLELSGVGSPTPLPRLQIQRAGSQVVITWAGSGFTLQEALAVEGIYNSLTSARSPFTNNITPGTKYYRLFRSQ